MGISMIDVLSSCLVLPWEQRNPFVRGPCSFSSESNFATFRTLSFSTNLSKGCLSMSTLQRPNRHSVVCMAKKRASSTDKKKEQKVSRKEVNRKKGGKQEQGVSRKKDGKQEQEVSRKEVSRKKGGKSKRKSRGRGKGRKKNSYRIVRLVSAAGTGFFYAKKKSRRIIDKLLLLKYDPCVKRHVLFEESEMKLGRQKKKKKRY